MSRTARDVADGVESADAASPDGAAPYDVDALRLLRLVHVRRDLRLVWRLTLLALPVWIAINIAWNSQDEDSYWWRFANSTGIVVLLVIIVLAVAGGAVLALLRFAGAAGRPAAALVPFAGEPAEPEVVDGDDVVAGFWPALRRRGYATFGSVVLVVLFTFGLVATSVSFWPAWQANHGRGGTVVTIGRDSTISTSDTGSHGETVYYLSTPDGSAVAEDGQPRSGERWTVVDNVFGRDLAYQVGSHDYVLLLLLVLAFAVFDLSVLAMITHHVFAERRRRRRTGHVPLRDAVTQLTQGGRARIAVGPARLGGWWSRSTKEIGKRQEFVIGLASRPATAAGRLVWRERATTFAATAGVLVVLAGLGALPTGIDPDPDMTEPDLTVALPYLAGTGWQASALVDPSQGSFTHDDMVDALHDAGIAHADVRDYRELQISSTTLRDSFDTPVVADVDVAEVGSVPSAGAVSAMIAAARQSAVDPGAPTPAVTGLPTGWRGVTTDPAGESTAVHVAAAADGVLVSIELDLDNVTPRATAGARGSAALRKLAAALAGHGLARVARQAR